MMSFRTQLSWAKEDTPIGLALALPSNSKTWLERISKDKPSSLLGLFVSDEEKKFFHLFEKFFSLVVVVGKVPQFLDPML